MDKTEPEVGEFVIVTVKKILPYGAFCSLDEYGGREAFLHISEVASRWIKNIREFLKEGQKIVVKVHRYVPEKRQIDLSLKRVTEAEKKRKLENHKREKRSEKLFETVARKLKKKSDIDEVGKALIAEFGDLYTALEEISFDSEAAFKKLKIGKEWQNALYEVASANIKKPRVEVNRIFVVSSSASNGVEVVKTSILSSLDAAKDFEELEVKTTYLGAPRYQISIVAKDYKTAEKAMGKIGDKMESGIKSKGGSFAVEEAS